MRKGRLEQYYTKSDEQNLLDIDSYYHNRILLIWKDWEPHCSHIDRFFVELATLLVCP